VGTNQDGQLVCNEASAALEHAPGEDGPQNSLEEAPNSFDGAHDRHDTQKNAPRAPQNGTRVAHSKLSSSVANLCSAQKRKSLNITNRDCSRERIFMHPKKKIRRGSQFASLFFAVTSLFLVRIF